MESYESAAGLEPEPVRAAPLAAPASLAVGVPLAPAIIFETFIIGIFLEAPHLSGKRSAASPVSAASAVGAGRRVVAALRGGEEEHVFNAKYRVTKQVLDPGWIVLRFGSPPGPLL